MIEIRSRLRRLRCALAAALLLAACTAPAPLRAGPLLTLAKDPSTDSINYGFDVPTGLTLRLDSGATLNLWGTSVTSLGSLAAALEPSFSYGDALTSAPLSQFAATTSAQLRGVLSDETGTGALVFATSPSFTTPSLGAASATSINGVSITASPGGLGAADNGALVQYGAGGDLTASGTIWVKDPGLEEGDTISLRISNDTGFYGDLRTTGLTDVRIFTLPDASGTLLLSDGSGASLTGLTKSQVGLGSVENTALSTWAGSTNLTTLGTIGTGTWQGSIIAPAYLGTGSSITTKFLRGDGTWQTVSGGGGSGDVVGPSSATDNAIVRFDSTTGKLVQDSTVTVNDSGVVAGASISGSSNTLTNIGNSALSDTISSNATLSVPGTYATIQAALDYLAGKRITQGATVTIQVADGTHTPSRMNLNHPDGGRIHILGNTTTPANCILDFTADGGEGGGYYEADWGGFHVSDGHEIGLIDGFKILGPTSTTHVPLYGFAALLAFNGATLRTGTHIVIEDCYSGAAAINGSTIFCDGISVRYAGDGALFAYQNSNIQAIGATLKDSNSWYAQAGAVAEFGSSLFLPNATIDGNDGCGVLLTYDGSAMLEGSTISNSPIGISYNKNGGYKVEGGITFTSVTVSRKGNVNEFDGGDDGALLQLYDRVNGSTQSAGVIFSQDIFAVQRRSSSGGWEANAFRLDLAGVPDNSLWLHTDGSFNTATASGTYLGVGGGSSVSEFRLFEASGNGSNYTGFKSPDSLAANVVYKLPTADGSAGQVLSTDGSKNLSWAAAGTGGSKTIAVFTPLQAEPAASNYATPGTRNSRSTLVFADSASNQETTFRGIIHEGAVLTSGLSVIIHWTTPGTSGNARFGAQIERGNTDIDADSFDTATETTTACNGTSGIESVTTCTLTNIDSITAGDAFVLKVYRDCSDSADTLNSTNVEVLAVELRTAN